MDKRKWIFEILMSMKGLKEIRKAQKQGTIKHSVYFVTSFS